MKLMGECCGNGKDNLIALATIDRNSNMLGQPRPAVRMVDAYYEDGVFYISTDATKNKMLDIEKNNEISICGLDLLAAYGIADNLGSVKDEKNAAIREKMHKIFSWFADHGDEDNPSSIILRVTLSEGILTDNE